MKFTNALLTAAIIFFGLMPQMARAHGNVSVSISQWTYALRIEGDNQDNSLYITSGNKRSLLIKARHGTTINGGLNELEITDYFEDILVDLRNGDDKLDIEKVDLEDTQLDIIQLLGDSEIAITQSRFHDSKVLSGGGYDVVKIANVEARLMRVADADGEFPVNAALPDTASFISARHNFIECLDLQARIVDVNRHHGALLVAATDANIQHVNALGGNASIGYFTAYPIPVEDEAVVIAAEYDSLASNVYVHDITAVETGVLYYDTLLNDRIDSNDSITIDQVETEILSVATGFGDDDINIRNVHATDEVLVDMASHSYEHDLDGDNFAFLYNVYCKESIEIVGGSNRDNLVLYALYATESLDVDTAAGSDEVRIYNSWVGYESQFLLGAGSDDFESYGSGLGILTLNGGTQKDFATQRYSSWRSPMILGVESHNF